MVAAAVVNVTSVFIFSVALRSVRLDPPHIAQDLLALAPLSHSGVDLRGICRYFRCSYRHHRLHGLGRCYEIVTLPRLTGELRAA
jgi:hypothetical protein